MLRCPIPHSGRTLGSALLTRTIFIKSVLVTVYHTNNRINLLPFTLINLMVCGVLHSYVVSTERLKRNREQRTCLSDYKSENNEYVCAFFCHNLVSHVSEQQCHKRTANNGTHQIAHVDVIYGAEYNFTLRLIQSRINFFVVWFVHCLSR